jgi:Spy/CpxP family protein refolding chaperone
MKKNTKWITAAAATLALSASLAIAAPNDGNGHGRGTEGGMGRHDGARLAEKLNLTDAQKQQWQALQQDFRQNNKAFFEQARQTREDFHAAKEAGDTAKLDALKPALDAQRAQMKQLRDAQDQKLVSILNADQKAQFETMKAARAQHREGHDRHEQ